MDSNNGVLSITAADIQVQGNINSGTAKTVITVTNGRTLSLGATDLNFDLTSGELGRITSTGMQVGGATCGDITMNAILATNSNSISGTITIAAGADDAQVSFATAGSTFNTASMQADNGIWVGKDRAPGPRYRDRDRAPGWV